MSVDTNSDPESAVCQYSTQSTTPYIAHSRLRHTKGATCFLAAIKHEDGLLYLHGYGRAVGSAGIGAALGRARQHFRLASPSDFCLGREGQTLAGVPAGNCNLQALAESLKKGHYGVTDAIVVPTTSALSFRAQVHSRTIRSHGRQIGDVTLWAETESVARNRALSGVEASRCNLCDEDGQLVLMMSKTCATLTHWTRVQPSILFHSVVPSSAYTRSAEMSLVFAIDSDTTPGSRYVYGLLSESSPGDATELERQWANFGITYDNQTTAAEDVTARVIKIYARKLLPKASVSHVSIATMREMCMIRKDEGRALADKRYLMMWEAGVRAMDAWCEWSNQASKRDKTAARAGLRPLLGRDRKVYMLDQSL